MQLAWQLGSPLFGLLLKHYAPSDTYKIWKVGSVGNLFQYHALALDACRVNPPAPANTYLLHLYFPLVCRWAICCAWTAR